MGQEIIKDIVCTVLANEKSSKTIYSVLNEFLPNYEKLNLDYTSPPDNEDYEFKSEKEMIDYFVNRKNLSQSFYWNKYESNPDKVMVGAHITDDDKLIISLTFNGTNDLEKSIYMKLKSFLNSDIGVITYMIPAEFDNGMDFEIKYRNNKYEFER